MTQRRSSLGSYLNLFQMAVPMAIIWAMIGAGVTPAAPASAPAGLGNGYWHTSGSQILDVSNTPVRIAGLNWYGFETVRQVPAGLDVQDYKTILQTIRANGYNTVRLPLSNQMVESPIVPTNISFTGQNHRAINTELRGLNSVQILDHIVAAAEEAGLKVILDNHRSDSGDGPQSNGLWYTPAYPESAWIADWTALANRYRNDPTVIGFDLRNEPHNADSGGACWSCGGANDWHLAAQRAGDAVLNINPRLLIFVEGTDGFENDFYWWGGNLEGVASAPVRLSIPNRLVYSAHDYGPAETGQPWLTAAATTESLEAVWTRHWAYISQQNIAPVWLGEFGAEKKRDEVNTPTAALQEKWFHSLVQFLGDDHRISWTYWAVNADDRYGIMNDRYDGIAWDPAKQEALAAIQFPLGLQSEETGTGTRPSTRYGPSLGPKYPKARSNAIVASSDQQTQVPQP
jgi:endoglucanase